MLRGNHHLQQVPSTKRQMTTAKQSSATPILDTGKWKFKARPRLFWAFALMSLDKVRRIRHRLILLTIGSPAASIFCGMVAILAGEIGLARYNSPWPTFLDFLGAWSLVIGFIGLFPFRVRGFANDGMLLRALLFSSRRPHN
jgi:hypothetical protein